MNIVGQEIRHKTFGVGTVTGGDSKYLRITFSIGEKLFMYPDAFTNFLIAVNDNVQAAILSEIAAEKEAKEAFEKLLLEAEEKKKAGKETAGGVKRQARITPKKTKDAIRHTYTYPTRKEGKGAIFYVFQGNTFDRERRGGYIWAPITNKAGLSFHHWDRLLYVRKGDIILHGCDGEVVAISTVQGECYKAQQPEELIKEDLWDHEGRRVDCDYILIDIPIRTKDYIYDITRLSIDKYSPFDRYGNGNMGYLYEINQELAKIFIQGLVARNHNLKDVGYINDILNEDNV